MKRVPEPEELMDDSEQALAYAEEDFAEARALFLDAFERLNPEPLGQVLDLGCGPADIPIALAGAYPDIHIDALDGADAMLAHARKALENNPRLAGRIRLHLDSLPSSRIPHGHYSAVISNSLLHHLSDPAVLWQTVRQCAAPGAHVLIMDLMRPADMDGVHRLVELHAASAPGVLRRDFHNSLCAAYEVDEVRHQLDEAGLGGLEVRSISDRHLIVAGILPA